MEIVDNYDIAELKVLDEILKIDGISKESDKIFSIDGTTFILELKEI